VKYPHLWLVLAVPARGVTTDAVRDAIRPELERLKTEDITDEELARFKTRAKADLIRSLNSNSGLAEQLTTYQVLFGDWRELFRYVDRMDAVTKADIRRVANDLFKDPNRIVGKIETK
jgi:predicted Zn-dependent peptidase